MKNVFCEHTITLIKASTDQTGLSYLQHATLLLHLTNNPLIY